MTVYFDEKRQAFCDNETGEPIGLSDFPIHAKRRGMKTIIERLNDAVAKFEEHNVVKPERLELTSGDAELLRQWGNRNLVRGGDKIGCKEELVGSRVHGLCIMDVEAKESRVLGPRKKFFSAVGLKPASRSRDERDDMLDSLHYMVSQMGKPNYLFSFVDDLLEDVDLSDHPFAVSDTRPEHYGGDSNPFEAIKIIEHYDLNFSLGNVIKYVLRCGRKENADEIEELKKARQYIDFEIARRERNVT